MPDEIANVHGRGDDLTWLFRRDIGRFIGYEASGGEDVGWDLPRDGYCG
jgi:hypothetical protein